MVRLVSSGIGPLDAFMDGGFPRGFTILLLAPTGSGAEVFSKQFAADHPDERVLFITTDESEKEVRRTTAEAGWDFSNVDIMDLQTDFASKMLEAQQEKQERDAGAVRFDPRDLVEGTDSRDLMAARRRHNIQTKRQASKRTDYLAKVIEPLTRYDKPQRVVVDSLDFLLNLYSVEDVTATVQAVKAANAQLEGLCLIVMSKGAHDVSTERRIELLADCVLELQVERKGTTFERFFIVKKVRNRNQCVGVSTYEITDRGFELETLERIV